MSTIEDWVDDYVRNSGLDTNVPQDGTTITTSGAASLADTAWLDTKQVIRAESLKKGWEPDARTITQIDGTSFKVASVDLRGTYHPYQAVRIQRASGEIIGAYVQSIALNGADSDITVFDIRSDKGVTQTLPSNVNKAWFSVYFPRGDPTLIDTHSYDTNMPSLGPLLWQTVTMKMEDGDAAGKTRLLYTYPDENWFAMAQCVAYTGTPDWGAFAVEDIVKRDNRLNIALVAAPGSGASVTWQVSTFYQIGG